MTNKPVFTERDFLCGKDVDFDNFPKVTCREASHMANAKIAPLIAELDNLKARDIHTCHADCERNGCVNRRLREALEFYAEMKHIDAASGVGSVNWDQSQMEWRVGPPYIRAVEYGQVARKALGTDTPA